MFIMARRLLRGLTCAFFFTTGAALHAADLYQYFAPFTVMTTREAGTGSQHSAYNDSFNVLMTNPAALYLVQTSNIIDAGFGFNADFGRLGSQLGGVTSGDGPEARDIEDYADANLRSAPPLLYLRGPLAWGYIEKGFGVGVFNQFAVENIMNYSEISRKNDGVSFRSNLNSDAMLNLAFSFNLADSYDHKFYWGFALKGLYRNVTNLANEDYVVGAKEGRSFVTRDSAEKNMFGAGSNLGALYIYSDRLSLAVTLDDALSAVYIIRPTNAVGAVDGNFHLLYPRLNFGVSWVVRNTSQFYWIVMADFRDALSPTGFSGAQDAALQCLSLGTEIIFASKISLRVGMAGLMPAIGFGYEFSRFSISFAFYGKEYDRIDRDYATFGAELGIRFNL